MPKYRFTDFAINSTEKKKPTEEDKDKYIGLEHLDSGTLSITRWGTEVAPIGEKLIMKKGDVLFGKRRAYQKKVGIAPFDGIFSAHGMVLRPKEEVITKEYFPLFISSDYFLNEAIRISVGSLSPTVNWKDLKELKFTIPTIEEQKRITPLIWAAIEAKNSYKLLIQRTDDLVKSQFIEMFGDPDTNTKKLKTAELADLFCVIRNGANIKQSKEVDGYPITRIETISDRTVDRKKMGYASIHELGKYSDYVLQDGDILMSHINSVLHLGKTALYSKIDNEQIIHGMNLLCLRPRQKLIIPIYIWNYFQTDYFKRQIDVITKPAVNQASFTTSDLKRLVVILPELSEQKRFVSFVQQSDKSKFELQQSIEKVDNLIKSLIQQDETENI